MIRAKIFLTIGVWIAILPYLGFPYSFRNILITLTGLVIIYFSYEIYSEHKKNQVKEVKSFDNFSENKDFSKTE